MSEEFDDYMPQPESPYLRRLASSRIERITHECGRSGRNYFVVGDVDERHSVTWQVNWFDDMLLYDIRHCPYCGKELQEVY